MLMRDGNRERLKAAARALGPVREEVVFVGGAVAGLLITDEGAASPRPTFDVDVVAKVGTYLEYSNLGERLESLGLRPDPSPGAPMCRWTAGEALIDVMPLDEGILGFSNRWYELAMQSAWQTELEPGLPIRVIEPVCFLATKLEAFLGRGEGRLVDSHDLEDLLAVVDGRETIVAELDGVAAELRSFLHREIGCLLERRGFADAAAGFLLPDAASQARLETVLDRLRGLAGRE